MADQNARGSGHPWKLRNKGVVSSREVTRKEGEIEGGAQSVSEVNGGVSLR
jgi:hypothetical protein